MPLLNIRTVLPANGVAQVLAGSVFEFITEPSTIEIGVAADATRVLMTINSGPETLLEESPTSVKLIYVPPVYPDDFFQDTAVPNDRLSVKVRDTTGAQRIIMTITPADRATAVAPDVPANVAGVPSDLAATERYAKVTSSPRG